MTLLTFCVGVTVPTVEVTVAVPAAFVPPPPEKDQVGVVV